jgi:hypothetical protein
MSRRRRAKVQVLEDEVLSIPGLVMNSGRYHVFKSSSKIGLLFLLSFCSSFFGATCAAGGTDGSLATIAQFSRSDIYCLEKDRRYRLSATM